MMLPSLSKTANWRLTHCTTCVKPTDNSVSGGSLLTVTPVRPTPTPKKLKPSVADKGVRGKGTDWTAVSGSLVGSQPGGVVRRGILRRGVASLGAKAAITSSGAEKSTWSG